MLNRILILLSLCLVIVNSTGFAAESTGSVAPIEWANRMARSEMKRRGASPKANWEYAQTVLSVGMMKLGSVTQQADIASYGEKLVIPCVGSDGAI